MYYNTMFVVGPMEQVREKRTGQDVEYVMFVCDCIGHLKLSVHIVRRQMTGHLQFVCRKGLHKIVWF